MQIALVKQIPAGYIETIDVEPYGVIRVRGWCDGEPPWCSLDLGGRVIVPDATYRVSRPDVAAALNSEDNFMGFMIEFFDARPPRRFVLQIDGAGTELELERPITTAPSDTAHGHLIATNRVYHRSDIYGFGPPIDHVNPDVLNLALRLPAPILDFGCGCGALIRELRQRGIEAYGIEIDREPIRRALTDTVARYIKLYDGRFPLPYAMEEFESVFSTEVIEHVEDYEQALAEIARVTRRSFGITVPDMSAIPIGSVHGVVPFHLLESTHVNFFSYNSLHRVLSKWFYRVQFFRVAAGTINGTFMPGSLGAIAEK